MAKQRGWLNNYFTPSQAHGSSHSDNAGHGMPPPMESIGAGRKPAAHPLSRPRTLQQMQRVAQLPGVSPKAGHGGG